MKTFVGVCLALCAVSRADSFEECDGVDVMAEVDESPLQLLQQRGSKLSLALAAVDGSWHAGGNQTGSPSLPLTNVLTALDTSLSEKVNSVLADTDDEYRYFKASAALVIALVATVMLLAVVGTSLVPPDQPALLVSANDKVENPKRYFKIALNDLIAMLGIPAFCVLDFGHRGLTGWPRRATLSFLTLQSWLLQGSALYLLLVGIKTSANDIILPRFSVGLATYLNILANLSEFPVSLLLLRHLNEFHKDSGVADRTLAWLIAFIGLIVVPCGAMVIGGLFLCTATNYCDLFMKSVVFKFISNIENMIAVVNSRTNLIAAAVEPQIVYLPNDKNLARLLNFVLVVVPLFPGALAFVLSGVGIAMHSA